MTGRAYYNEIDPFAAAWLRELIDGGHIAPGDVDERDIRDVRPDELTGYRQCHFFAGIGVWSHSLRRAGWSDDREIWTASLPCQPWSSAGKGEGFNDERHLWPAFNELRLSRRPVVAIGEQVASKDGLAWLDAVQTDVEASGDAFGAVDLCAAGFGSPNIRQRLYWLAYASHIGQHGGGDAGTRRRSEYPDGRCVGVVDDTAGTRYARSLAEPKSAARNQTRVRVPDDRCSARILADPPCEGLGRIDSFSENEQASGRGLFPARPSGDVSNGARATGPTNGLWQSADWLGCRDGKWRAVEPGSFPLADGAPARVGRLRGYGNAINAEVATGFIEAVMDTLDQPESLAA